MPKTMRLLARAGHDLHGLHRHDAPVLSLTRGRADRTVRSQQRRPLESSWLSRAEGQGEHAPGLVASRRVPHRPPRQVPEPLQRDRPHPTDVAPGWDEWDTALSEEGPRYYGYALSRNGRRVTYGEHARDHVTRVLNHAAVRLIRTYTPRKRPLYLQLDQRAPHLSDGPHPWTMQPLSAAARPAGHPSLRPSAPAHASVVQRGRRQRQAIVHPRQAQARPGCAPSHAARPISARWPR